MFTTAVSTLTVFVVEPANAIDDGCAPALILIRTWSVDAAGWALGARCSARRAALAELRAVPVLTLVDLCLERVNPRFQLLFTC